MGLNRINAGGSGSAHRGDVANEAAMLALPSVAVGETAHRLDVLADFRCVALPSSSAANWQQVAGSNITTRSDGYHTHFFAPLAIDSSRKALDISGAFGDGAFQANLSATTAWATAGFLTQPNPSVANELSLVTFPAIQWDWSAGDSLFIFWMGRMTPEAAAWCGDTPSFVYNSGFKLGSTADGKLICNAYAAPSTAVYGPTSTNVVFEAAVTHSLAVCMSPAGMCFWTDGLRNPGHAGGGFSMPAGGPCSTVNNVPFKLGGDGQVLSNIQVGVALQTKALVILKGRRGNPPAVADLDALVAALHANPSALVSSDAW